jgi:hypothetical protein
MIPVYRRKKEEPMEHKEMKIDVASVAKQALQERQPAEEMDEALLRVAKDRYGESGPVVFQAIRAARSAVAKRNHVSVDEALQQMMDRQRSISLIRFQQGAGTDEAIY